MHIKFSFFVCLLGLCLVFCVGCHVLPTPVDLNDIREQLRIELEDTGIIPPMTESSDRNETATLYGITDAQYTELIVLFPEDRGADASEVVLVRAASEQNIALLQSAFAKRNQKKYTEWETRNSTELKKILHYRLVIRSDCLLYVVSEQAERVEEIFTGFFD